MLCVVAKSMLTLVSALSLLSLVLCTNTSVVTQEALLRVSLALHSDSWKLPPAAVEWDESANISFCFWHGVTCCTASGPSSVAFLQHSAWALPCDSLDKVGALELQELQITAEYMPWDVLWEVQGLSLLNVSFNPSLRGEVLSHIGLPSTLSVLDTRGTQLKISNEDGKGLAFGLYADMDSETYIVTPAGRRPTQRLVCHWIFSQYSGTLILVDGERIPEDACHCLVNGYKRKPQTNYCIRNPEFTAINIIFLCLLVIVLAVLVSLLLRWLSSCTAHFFLHMFLNFAKGKYAPGDLPPRVAELLTGSESPHVTMVYTDVQGSTRLWEWDNDAMGSAIYMHDALMRKLLRRYSGYEVATEGDAFIVAFHTVVDAMQWAMHAQIALMDLLWPDAFAHDQVLNCAASVYHGNTVIFTGLRVRMAIESGPVTSTSTNEMTGRLRMEGVFFVDHCINSPLEGPFLPILELLADTGDGGQCIVGQECTKLLRRQDKNFTSVPQPKPLLQQYLSRYKDLSATEWQTGQVRILIGQADAQKKTLQEDISVAEESPDCWQTRLLPGSWFNRNPGGENSAVQSNEFKESLQRLYRMITCQGSIQRRRSGSLNTPSQSFLSHTVAERISAAIHVTPSIMHMGDYLTASHSATDNLPISVYQAFPTPLLARAFHVQRTLSGLGPISSPSFLCHPMVTADLLGVPKLLFEHPSQGHSKWTEVTSVFVSWAEQPHMHGPVGEYVSRATSVCMLLCASQFGGYLSEGTSSGKRLLLFKKVTDAINFSINLQRVLLNINWTNFEGRVTALWRAPRMPPAPCVRIAIDHSSVDSVVLSPASGRVFAPGPQVSRVIAMAHAAAPGECMMTKAAFQAWNSEIMDNSLDGGTPATFQRLLPSNPNTFIPSDEFQRVTALMSAVQIAHSTTGTTDASFNFRAWSGPQEKQQQCDAVDCQTPESESELLNNHPDTKNAAVTRLCNSILSRAQGDLPYTSGFLQEWLAGTVPGGYHESDSDCGHLNCTLPDPAGTSSAHSYRIQDENVDHSISTDLTTSLDTTGPTHNSSMPQPLNKVTREGGRRTCIAIQHESDGADDDPAERSLLLEPHNSTRHPRSRSSCHIDAPTNYRQSGTKLSWVDEARIPVAGISSTLAAHAHASHPSVKMHSTVKGKEQNAPITGILVKGSGQQTSNSFKSSTSDHETFSNLRKLAPQFGCVRVPSFRRGQVENTIQFSGSTASCCESSFSVDPDSHPHTCPVVCTNEHCSSVHQCYQPGSQERQRTQTPVKCSALRSGDKLSSPAGAVTEGLQKQAEGQHRWQSRMHEQSKLQVHARSRLSIDGEKIDIPAFKPMDSPDEFFVAWNKNYRKGSRRMSRVSYRAWGKGQSEPDPFASLAWEQRRRGHPSQQAHPLGAVCTSMKKLSRRLQKWKTQYMFSCCTGCYGKKRRDFTLVTGTFERSSKVLDGWGTKTLPEPPTCLRRARYAGAHEDGKDVPSWPPTQDPKQLPQNWVRLSKEYHFLLKDKRVSQGMLAMFCGATFRVKGHTDTFMTYTITAGNMLPLRQLVHAAPDLATYPVQIVRQATRELHTCAYMPPADLGYITQVVQRILDSAPTTKLGEDGIGDVSEGDLQSHWGRSSETGNLQARVRSVRNTI